VCFAHILAFILFCLNFTGGNALENLDQRIAQLNEKTVFFDTDTEFVVCDNSANTHVCNNNMFTELHLIENPTHVATIGGRNTLPSGIGKVKRSWSDDNGKKQEA
jgi:hypothetical protein